MGVHTTRVSSGCFAMTFLSNRSTPQTDPPVAPQKTLPTMYDLPSEFPEEPGLPDEFHDLQPQLLSRTLQLKDYAADNRFTGSDLNLYYDGAHPLWHKRPDWFLALDVPRVHKDGDARRSYVVWQEHRAPSIVVEFLSPRTEKEDFGRFYRSSDQIEPSESAAPQGARGGLPANASASPPSKLEVYEKYLRVPHYVVYSRYTQQLRYFRLTGTRYEEQPVKAENPVIWLADLEIGLGLWDDYFEGLPGPWLRWCDDAGNWFLTDTEQEREAKEQEREAKEQERKAKEQEREAREAAQLRADKLAAQLKALGIEPEA